ncbi:nuclear transport factor 2 family protein [Burkholderia sp. FERM BP-3421]|jgi:steroid Delta-isomerase|uniref:nuclear transport factor 2 family protein n=1 Tax=Burkholderia sp. FERM BP-3421 TaxID=1494466 RepID=UPI0023601077|nr:nuclear transport factor 2 family protein [Burkholderia sp. FERM BP-3421]WDD93033.1 nuclear transport factor 2 family protein [Burkholderia sp. FERM BP-3421]
MTDTSDARLRHIHHAWHAAVVARDLDALLALYTDDAVLESPLILVALPDRRDGVLRGKDALRAFFATGLRAAASAAPTRWHRSDVFLTHGNRLVWEYPRATPDGDQTDLVEVMDLDGERIAHHRVYWGWTGFLALSAMRRGDAA